MQGRRFLQLAEELVVGTQEYHSRGATIHSYYALFLECRDALGRWAIGIGRQDVHHAVRLKFAYARDADLKSIADHLDWLVRRRGPASYDLSARPDFADESCAQEAIVRATKGLALLDAIDFDPTRRAAAIAFLPP